MIFQGILKYSIVLPVPLWSPFPNFSNADLRPRLRGVSAKGRGANACGSTAQKGLQNLQIGWLQNGSDIFRSNFRDRTPIGSSCGLELQFNAQRLMNLILGLHWIHWIHLLGRGDQNSSLKCIDVLPGPQSDYLDVFGIIAVRINNAIYIQRHKLWPMVHQQCISCPELVGFWYIKKKLSLVFTIPQYEAVFFSIQFATGR